jgi:hypothetical protein
MRWPHWRSAVTVGASLLRSSLPNGRRWNKGQLLTIRAFVDHHSSRLRKTQGDEFQYHRATALLATWNVRRGLLIMYGQISMLSLPKSYSPAKPQFRPADFISAHRPAVSLSRLSCSMTKRARRRQMPAFVQVFGRRDDKTIHALRRPASKKRQGTKSRGVGHWLAASAMGI